MEPLGRRPLRTRLPAKTVPLPNSFIKLVRSCIGKDLFHVSLPAELNEPLSLLQRGTEVFEYSNLLSLREIRQSMFDADVVGAFAERGDIRRPHTEVFDEALETLHVGLFAMSVCDSFSSRIKKPFNPLLGETFECHGVVPDGSGQNVSGRWRLLSEQVSHHPPAMAALVEGMFAKERRNLNDVDFDTPNATSNGAVSHSFVFESVVRGHMRFWGNSLHLTPDYPNILKIRRNSHSPMTKTYVWNQLPTNISGIFTGRLSVHFTGTLVVKTRGSEMSVKFHGRNVEGVVLVDNSPILRLKGEYNGDIMVALDTECSETHSRGLIRTFLASLHLYSEARDTEHLKWILAWCPKEHYHKLKDYYDFTEFCLGFNYVSGEHDQSPLAPVPPHIANSDSRRRLDIRYLEHGQVDEANRIKNLYEIAQRERHSAMKVPTMHFTEASINIAHVLDVSESELESGTKWSEHCKIQHMDFYKYAGTYWELHEASSTTVDDNGFLGIQEKRGKSETNMSARKRRGKTKSVDIFEINK